MITVHGYLNIALVQKVHQASVSDATRWEPAVITATELE
jgi:hypothetical protein